MAVGGAERWTVEEVAAALRATGGIHTFAARRLGCAPNTIANYIRRYPELKQIEEEVTRTNLDIAESGLLLNIKAKDVPSIKFYLSTKGRERGYGGGKPGRPFKPETIAARDLDLTKVEGRRTFYERLAWAALEKGDDAAAMRAVDLLKREAPIEVAPLLPPMHTPEGRMALVEELALLPLDLLEEAVARARITPR